MTDTEKIHILLCCWRRLFNLKMQIQSLEDQTVSNQIVLHLIDNSGEEEKIKNIISEFKDLEIKIEISHYDNSKSCFQRFFYIRDILLKNWICDYVIIIDDDMLFNDNWVEELYQLREPKTFVPWYGKIWNEKNKNNYWIGMVDDCQTGGSPNITEFDYGGPGGSVIDSKIFEHDSEIFHIPEDLVVYDKDDIWISYVIKNKKDWKIRRSFLPPIMINDHNPESKNAAMSMSIEFRKQKQKVFEDLFCNRSYVDRIRKSDRIAFL